MAGLLQKAGLAAFQPPDGFGAVLLGRWVFRGGLAADVVLFRQHHMGWREALGLRGPQLSRALIMAALPVIAFLPVALGLRMHFDGALAQAGWPPEEQMAVTLLAGTKSWGMRFISAASPSCSRRWPRNLFSGACCIRSSSNSAGRGWHGSA